jgi:hypothetical protein
MDSCGCAATRVTLNIWWRSVATATAQTGAVALIQRFGSALNLNVHFHMLLLNVAFVVLSGPSAHMRSTRDLGDYYWSAQPISGSAGIIRVA